jgi:preprotein translocase subunit SecD
VAQPLAVRAAAFALGLAIILGIGSCGETDPPSGRVVLEPVGTLTDDELEEAADVMRARLEKLGIDRAEVDTNDHTVIVRLPRSKLKGTVPVLTRPGRFEVFDFQGDLVGPSVDSNGYAYPLTAPPKRRANSVVVSCKVVSCPGFARTPQEYYYLLRYEPDDPSDPAPEMTEADFQLAETSVKFDPNAGEPAVLIAFTEEGAEKFEAVTRTMAERGRAFHEQVGGPHDFAFQQLAIVIDREIKSAPIIDYRDNPAGIQAGAGAQIMVGDLAEAKQLALLLQTGALPVPFRRVHE